MFDCCVNEASSRSPWQPGGEQLAPTRPPAPGEGAAVGHESRWLLGLHLVGFNVTCITRRDWKQQEEHLSEHQSFLQNHTTQVFSYWVTGSAPSYGCCHRAALSHGSSAPVAGLTLVPPHPGSAGASSCYSCHCVLPRHRDPGGVVLPPWPLTSSAQLCRAGC